MRASAVIYQDAHFLHPNRIALVGARDKQVELLGLKTDGVIEWEEYVRPDWYDGNDPGSRSRRSGTGWVRSSGIMQGAAIADDSIQPFADIQILKNREHSRGQHLTRPRVDYVFLQRPDDWYVPRRSWLKPDPPRVAGPWKIAAALGIRFRMLTIIHGRDDERTSQEHERITLPGIEIAPIGACVDDATFFDAAERLWFLVRVLLVFRFRQFVHPLAETKVGLGSHEVIWHNVRLEPRERSSNFSDPPFLGPLEVYLARGVAALLAMEQNRELLHAANYGYANSYKAGAMESGLTSCVEGIERLLEAFEQARGLTRDVIDRKRWKKLSKEARSVAVPLGKTVQERDAMERALSGAPMLRLFERIERMVKAQRPKWRALLEKLLEGAEGMIKARNAIAHGRMVTDLGDLRIEILRAQLLFERLWLGLINCPHLPTTGVSAYRIQFHATNEKSVDEV